MSLTKLIPSLLVTALAIGVTTAPARAQSAGAGANVVITDVDLDGVTVVNGVLNATGGTISGTIAGLPFTTDVEDFALRLVPGTGAQPTCSVLDLTLGPIDVDLLGLHVDTSPICLNITGIRNQGPLGNLLCGLASGGLLSDVLAGLPGVLSPVMTNAMQQAGPPASGAEDICDGECEILDLALGPVDLTLLGLNVQLDDCDNGPVQVCVSASEGEGLLGELLCGLAGNGILPNLGLLEDLVGAILDGVLDQVSNLNLSNKQIDKLVKEVGKLLRDGQLSDNDLSKVTKSIGKLIRKA